MRWLGGRKWLSLLATHSHSHHYSRWCPQVLGTMSMSGLMFSSGVSLVSRCWVESRMMGWATQRWTCGHLLRCGHQKSAIRPPANIICIICYHYHARNPLPMTWKDHGQSTVKSNPHTLVPNESQHLTWNYKFRLWLSQYHPYPNISYKRCLK